MMEGPGECVSVVNRCGLWMHVRLCCVWCGVIEGIVCVRWSVRGWKSVCFCFCARQRTAAVVMVWFELSVGGNWSCDSGELEYRQCLV